MFDHSEGRLASVGLINVTEDDMNEEKELIPFKFCTKENNIIDTHKSKLRLAISVTNQFSDYVGGGSVRRVDEGVYVLQVVTTTADPVVGSLEQLEQKSP